MTLLQPVLPPPYTTSYSNVAVIFLDISGFVALTSALSDQQRVIILHQIYTVIENHTLLYNAQIIKYLGDGCLLVCGLNGHINSLNTSVNNAINLSIALHRQIPYPTKYAITCGDLVGGYIGDLKTQFDVWGSIVDRCARILETTTSNAIHVCDNTDRCHSLPISFSQQPLKLKDFATTSVYQFLL